MVSSTVGWSTSTGWKRRSSAASFSMYLRYSSSVVAPMVCSSPRASIGLSMFDASIEPFGRARADHRVQLVDEQDDLAVGVGDLLEHGLEALLELAAELRAGDQRAHVEPDDALVLEALGHVAADDALREPLDDGGLADAGLADEHRVVLRAAREHLDDAADFLVAADDRVELALARQLGQVAAVALERLVLALGVLVGDALRPANRLQRLEEPLAGHAAASAAGGRDSAAPALGGDGQQQVLGADELVLHLRRFGLRGRQDLRAGGATAPGDAPPCARGRPPSAACSRDGDLARVESQLAEHLRARCRSGCSTSAASRCSGSTCGWPACSAACCAATTASCAFSVNRFSVMACLLGRGRPSSWPSSNRASASIGAFCSGVSDRGSRTSTVAYRSPRSSGRPTAGMPWPLSRSTCPFCVVAGTRSRNVLAVDASAPRPRRPAPPSRPARRPGRAGRGPCARTAGAGCDVDAQVEVARGGARRRRARLRPPRGRASRRRRRPGCGRRRCACGRRA